MIDASFATIFGREAAVTAAAPGRVNLIGEHTDYNGGLVLPLALPLEVRVAIAPRPDATVRAWSANVPEDEARAELTLGAERRTGGWIDYVQAVTSTLAGDGHVMSGFDLAIASDVPLGSGLASSAALLVAVLRGLRSAFMLALTDREIATAAHRAETEFVGAPVGVMDQLVASLGREGTALLIDTRTLDVADVPMPSGVELAVIDSGLRHQHATGDYRVRRDECMRAAARLAVPYLCALGRRDLPRLATLPAPLSGRARHVVTEHLRVAEAAEAMRAGDVETLGRLWLASHASERDDFEVSLPAIDTLVDLAAADAAVLGARLTGGGFGGSVILLCRAGEAAEAAIRVQRAYQTKTGHAGRVLLPGETERQRR
ncbi:MAG TPA: galactokinase [Vicinamibacterales bacterium]|nr:galactokinase [Vicinamibacterales bacterium]